MSMMKLKALNDPEEMQIPEGLPLTVDAHVHIFPKGIFNAIWNWFDRFAWPIRYRFGSEEVLNFLLDRNVGHIVAFQYAHKPGMSRELNTYMANMCQQFPGRVTGMATVFPGEENQERILKDAFEMGLSGVKLHAHVQCFDMNSDEMNALYQVCCREKKPLVMHVSREPKSDAYNCDPYELCSAEKLAIVLKNFPDLKLCVPHLGVDEFISYQHLIEKYDTLWLDTAMAVTDYLPINNPLKLTDMRMDRIMYGSDFPNIPYAWDRELKWFQHQRFTGDVLERVLGKNALEFFNIEISNL